MHGEVERAQGFGCSDHVCWGYESREELARVASAWLHEGARLGQRLVYVGDRSPDGLLDDLAALPDVEGLVADGVLGVFTHDQLYDLSAPIDAELQLATYAAAVDQAVADGFAGIRVVADITALVAEPARRPSHARWEHHADRWMAHNPLAALCAYDAGTLGAGIGPIACVHPARHIPGGLPSFSLWADDDGRTVLEGEVDAFGAEALAGALAALPVGDDVVVDVSELRFMDASAAATIAAAARHRTATGGRLRLRGCGRAVRLVWEVLDLDRAVLAA